MINNYFDYCSIVRKLNNYTKAYDEGNPVITDQEWDALYFEVEEYERTNPNKISSYSPTQTISYTVVSELNKVEHNHLMLSLAKTKDINEIKSFINDKDYIAMAKMDGLTCSLLYEDGKLVRAETRGNGTIGEDITHNALIIPSIPKIISETGKFIVDGEIICTYQDFNFFANEYKNPRNFASGSIRLLDNKECKKRHLTFVAWDCINSSIKTLYEKLYMLDTLGFITVPHCDYNDITKDIDFIKEECKDTYPIDGLVFKYDDCDYYDSLGNTDHHFRGGIAYKFYDEEYETNLKDIEWTLGRTGVLTPVAIFEPVDIDGSTIEKASLHNYSIMMDTLHYAFIGQKIKIYKANQIIPQICEAEIVSASDNYPFLPNMPMKCPVCGGHVKPVESDSHTINIVCDNPNCEGKLLTKIDHYLGKDGLDVKGISRATIEKLIDWGWIENFEDIYMLQNHRNEWLKKPGFGVSSVDKILNAIAASQKDVNLASFISAIGIPLIGKVQSKEIVKHLSSWVDFRNATKFKYDGFGPERENAILNFNYTEFDKIANNFLTFEKNSVIINIQNKLSNKIFVITGSLLHYKNRDELKSIIEQNGGKVSSSVSKKTTYLINNDINSNSSKNETAKKLNIPIITEEDFIIMLQGENNNE